MKTFSDKFDTILVGVEKIMKILSVNAGSSTLKFKLFDMPQEFVLTSGSFERIGIQGGFYTIKWNGEKIRKEVELEDHTQAFQILMKELLDLNIVNDLKEIGGVGHRIVQGADHYNKSVVITKEVKEDIASLSSLAPLHNPAAVKGIEAAQEVIPNAIHVAVFDTAFHQTMPKENYLYALPEKWYTDYQVRRYGAHGTSHQYVSEYMAKKLQRDDLKLIVCHIGSGASISAIQNGRCVNTSMGFTPNAGLIMGTRCGDIDATILLYIMEKTGLTPEQLNTILNKESGLLALTGGSSDLRDIDVMVEKGEEKGTLALQMFVNRIVDYIAKYYFELQGVDAIVFTAGVGENGVLERRMILEKLAFLGVKVSEGNEATAGYLDYQEGSITTTDSTIQAYVVPTDEEVMIARDTYHNL